ncbi:MAG: hypothetical protein Q9187_001149 [Circinaria calcarea]
MARLKRNGRKSPSIQRSPENPPGVTSNTAIRIPSESVQAVLKAVGILLLAAIYSPVSLLSLSPVYGSIPPSVHHSRITVAAFILAWTAKGTTRSLPWRNVAKHLPLLAYSIPTAQYYLFMYSGQLGPVYGPILTEMLTYFPLIAFSVVLAGTVFDTINLGRYGGHSGDAGFGIVLYIIFGTMAKVSQRVIQRNIGSNFVFTRSGLQLVIASFYSLLLPSKLLLLSVLPILHSIFINIHIPTSDASIALNSTLQAHNFSLVARQESLTGYISVLDNFEHGFRVMRCDHSLLGGEWTTPPMGYRGRMNEPIYAIFTMLEAVRLVRTEATDKIGIIPDYQPTALVIGLGVGTTPAALIAHGIATTTVEIDPVVHEFATLYFDLPKNHTSIIEDAVMFVARVQAAGSRRFSYNYIIHDVFTGGAEPADLFTQEFIQGLSDLLKRDGVIAIASGSNYAGDLLMPSASLVVRTVKSVFPSCRLFREDAPPDDFSSAGIETPTKDFTNMVMFCRKSKGALTFRNPVEADYLGSQGRKRFLLPTHEIDSSYFEERKGDEKSGVLRKGQTGVLENYQRSSACRALAQALGNKVTFPGSSVYVISLQSYFSAQEEELTPACIVTPSNTKDVATAIKTLASIFRKDASQGHFAVRGGGHNSNAGSANIEDGVTLDLRALDGVAVNADKTVVSVGGGAVWGDVYMKLDAMNVSVSGGRVSGVGVGGLTTGGGISFFAPRFGFACDNVVNFEIVLSSGGIVNANIDQHRDLWLALKGGSNNFGVVTRFDLRAFAQGEFWGGAIQHPISTALAQITAFSDFNNATNYDVYASLITNFAYASGQGYVVGNNLEYTKPVVNPPVFQPLTGIEPQISSTMRISNLTDFTNELNTFSPGANRQLYISTTFKNDVNFLREVYNMWNAATQSIANVTGLVYPLTWQPLLPAITEKTALLGGNSLGLDPSDGALVLCLVSAVWSLASDDARVTASIKELFDQIDKASMAAGLFHRFKYLNYAVPWQDPISGYGPENKARLQAVSKKYDPIGLFQIAVPGGFKLFTS